MICPRCSRDAPTGAIYCPFCGRALAQIPRTAAKRGNRTGSAYKRGSSWTARWTIDSYTDENKVYHQIRRTKGGFQTKKAALEYCATANGLPDRTAPKLIEYWRTYESGRLMELSRDKQSGYRTAWNRWKPLWYYRIDLITTSDLQRVVSESAKTFYPAHDMRSVMSNLFRMAAAEGFVNKDLPSFISLPALKEEERVPFSDLEQANLWKLWESGCLDAGIPLTMIYTGMMPGELMKLRNEMIDLQNHRIIGSGLKTEVRRNATVYLPDAILPVLERMVQTEPERKLEQPFPRGEQSFYNHYYAALEQAGTRRLTPYSCRHTTATALAITKQIAPNTIKQVMRWSTTRMLDRYAHPDDQSAFDAINTLQRGTPQAGE